MSGIFGERLGSVHYLDSEKDPELCSQFTNLNVKEEKSIVDSIPPDCNKKETIEQLTFFMSMFPARQFRLIPNKIIQLQKEIKNSEGMSKNKKRKLKRYSSDK